MANDTFTQLNPGAGGDALDEQLVVYPVNGSNPTNRKRARVVITGTQIGDIVDVLAAAPDGSEISVPVRLVPDPAGSSIAQYGTVTLVGQYTETTVATYVVPPGKSLRVKAFNASGEVGAKFILYIQGTPILAARSSPSTPTAAADFHDADFIATAGQAVTLKTTHVFSGSYSFEATILGRLF